MFVDVVPLCCLLTNNNDCLSSSKICVRDVIWCSQLRVIPASLLGSDRNRVGKLLVTLQEDCFGQVCYLTQILRWKCGSAAVFKHRIVVDSARRYHIALRHCYCELLYSFHADDVTGKVFVDQGKSVLVVVRCKLRGLCVFLNEFLSQGCYVLAWGCKRKVKLTQDLHSFREAFVLSVIEDTVIHKVMWHRDNIVFTYQASALLSSKIVLYHVHCIQSRCKLHSVPPS